MTLDQLLIAVPALPLLGALIVVLFGWRLGEKAHLPIVAAFALSFVCSLLVLNEVRRASLEIKAGQVGYEHVVTLWTWADIPGAYWRPNMPPVSSQPAPPADVPFKIDVTLRADPLTAIMLAMVTFISTLVAVYASGYMHGDPGYWRFFAYIGLFVFSMTMLVSVSNFVLLFVFWEAVGACSYLLICFCYQKPEAAAAGKKAFLVNRVGDFGFAIALFLIWLTYGSLNYHDSGEIAGVLGQTRLANPALFATGGVAVAICALLMLGACGKSAQFPLHVWLPDAMEGPTPVSALIHAATMVTAGVYMVTRCTPLFVAAGPAPLFHVGEEAFTAQMLVSVIGGCTALLAGLIALTQTDLKRVLAYSTVSQLGYMFLSLGTGSLLGIVAGMFHLFTHAFFKALLFLGAGSVMHAMGGIIDMRQFSGLRRLMPVTCATFAIGCLALAGVVPLAGFWSKDEVLAALHERAYPHAAHEAATPHAQAAPATHTLDTPLATASTTKTFHLVKHRAAQEGTTAPGHSSLTAGDSTSHGTLAPRLYGTLYWVALFCAGLTAFYTFRAFFMTFYGPEVIPPQAGHHAHESPPVMTTPLLVLALCSMVVGLLFGPSHAFFDLLHRTPSLSFGAFAEVGPPGFHWDIATWSTLVALAGIGLSAYLYLGERSEVAVITRAVQPLYELSYGKFFIDQLYMVLFVFPATVLAFVCYAIDRWIIDGLVNFIGAVPAWCGQQMRLLQNGMVQFYALAMVLGTIVLIWGMVFYGV
ncbi:MAG: NADH-quinone oxidoreductase subunit L [Pirellulales bacterium]|nr:NADH-quinone oxidoreductase subunit L [Pirellulales bacterium]